METKDKSPALAGRSAVCSEPDKRKLESKAKLLFGTEWLDHLESVKTAVAEGQRRLVKVYGRSGSGMTTFCEQVKGSEKVLKRYEAVEGDGKGWERVYYLKGIGQAGAGKSEIHDHCQRLQTQLYRTLEMQQQREAEPLPSSRLERKKALDVSLKVIQQCFEPRLLDLLLFLV